MNDKAEENLAAACSGEKERVGEMDAKCKKQLPPTDRNTNSPTDRNTNSEEAADPSPPLATFEVPTEPLASAVSSMYTLPEMYHGTNLYPSLGDDDVKEDVEQDIHPKPTTKHPTCATAATATKRSNDNEDDKDVNSTRMEQDALVSMVPIQPSTNIKKDPTSDPVLSKTVTATKMPNDNDDDDDDDNVNSMDVLDFSVQPLPSGTSTNNASSVPGAHFLPGFPGFPRPSQRSPDSVDPTAEGLVEARTVPDEELQKPIAIALEHQDTQNSNRPEPKGRLCLGIFVVGILVLVLIILMVVLLTPNEPQTPSAVNNATSNHTGSSSKGDTTTTTSYLESLLPMETMVQVQGDPTSAQAKAFQWISEDPLLQSLNSERLLQRYALATFYYSTNGHAWNYSKDWLDYTVHECEWAYLPTWIDHFGAQIGELPPCGDDQDHNATTGHYKHLSLSMNHLQGSLPPELFWLTHLESIDLLWNSLTGTLSSSFGALTRLEDLNLAVNYFSGVIPSQLGALTKLTRLLVRGDYQGTKLHGTIPPQLGNLTNLVRFGIALADINGTLPTELCQMTSVLALDLADTQLSGPLPTQIGLMTSLAYAWYYNNQLTSLPSQIGLLTGLAWLDLSGNQMVGSIPTQVGHLSAMQELSLANNRFTSTLPTELSQLARMYALNLGGNHFSGSISSELGLLQMLETLDLSSNALTSGIPSALGNLPPLRDVHLQDNQFNGTLPLELTGLQALEVWNSANNQLSGDIPSLSWPNLLLFNISNNKLLSGSIPDGFCGLNASGLSFDCSHLLCGCTCPCPFTSP